MSDKSLYLPPIEVHFIDSKHVRQRFEIRVMRPVMKKDGSERFPVLYSPDANSKFEGLRTLSFDMQFTRHVPRYMLVGIGYPGGDIFASNMINLRMRDLLSLPAELRARHAQELNAGMPSPIEGLDPPTGIENLFCGAGDFLKFIRLELMPFIAERYPIIESDRGYFGFSGGGCFGLYAMFQEPDTFTRYVIGSPGLTFFGEDVYIDQARAFIESGRALNARVQLSIGLAEQFERVGLGQSPANGHDAGHGMVSDYYRLIKLLQLARVPGLELTHRAFSDEVHMPGWAPAFTHGMRAVYGPPEV